MRGSARLRDGFAPAAAAAAVALGGCGGTALLPGSHTGVTSVSSNARAYLASLSRAQAKLADEERALERRPGGGARLARSIRLLQAAIGRLGDDLGAIRPPAQVAAAHRRLVALVRGYSAALRGAERTARRRNGELRAARLLISATSSASRGFTATVSQIEHDLGVRGQ